MFLVWDTMKHNRVRFLVLAATLLLGSIAHISTAVAASNLGACTTIGQSKKIAKVNYVCAKSGKKKVWTRVSTTTATTIAPEEYEAPTTASGNVGDCKLIENSPERNRWGSIFAAFPPIGGNFEPTGTFKVALIPIDWSDLPGEANPLSRATDQIALFNEWYDMASEGKVKFLWSTYDKYVRVPGSALDFKQARSGAGDSLANAAIKAADPYVDFTGVRAVYFLPPKGQKVFMESSQAFKDLNLSAPIPTNEGPILNYALAGAYFDEVPLNYWSYWVHETGHMFKLPDLKYNWNNWGQVELPVPIGPFSGFDMFSNQDGPSRNMSAWLRWIIGWLPESSVFCQDVNRLTPTRVMLNPIDTRTSQVRTVMIRISDTKLVAIESRRPSKFDCSHSTNRAGVLVYTVDATVGHGEGTQTLIPPAGRGVISTNCHTPVILDAILNQGDSVTTNGITVKVVRSATYDTIEISRNN
jgi:M6 family metalloprotease-like protein